MSGRPTKGPCREFCGDIIADGDAASNYYDYVIAGLGLSFGARSSPYSPVKPNTPEGKANANLIVEAFNVYHETQLTPRELADQRAELLEACKVMLSLAVREYSYLAHSGTPEGKVIAKTRAAIAKAGAA